MGDLDERKVEELKNFGRKGLKAIAMMKEKYHDFDRKLEEERQMKL
jgi:hypothetical protein